MMQSWRKTVVGACVALSLLAVAAFPADNNVVVVLDDSGSMKQPMAHGMLRIEAAKLALSAVLSQLPPETRVGVLTLNTRYKGEHWLVPMGPVGDAAWKERIGKIQAKGGTQLGEFSKIGADALLNLRAEDRYGTYRLLIVTDGEATDAAVLNRYLPDILSRGLTLDVIGVSMANEHTLASSAHSYRRADDVETLTSAISEVFAETVGDDQSGQSDFDLIQGLPDGYAEEIIKRLTVVNNEPIREAAFSVLPSGTQLQSPTSPSQSAGDSVLSGLLCCCGTLVGLFFVAAILVRAVWGSRRR